MNRSGTPSSTSLDSLLDLEIAQRRMGLGPIYLDRGIQSRQNWVVASNILTAQTIDRLKQAFKIGLSAALSYYLAQFLRLPESYWAPISAIIVMYSDVSKTVKASTYRLIGTAIGVTIGA